MGRHDDLTAQVGDLWIASYSGHLVSIVKNDEHFITYLRMEPNSKQERRKKHKSDFYAIFRKINEDDVNGKTNFAFKEFLKEIR